MDEWREAELSAKWGAVARTRKRSDINTVQTNRPPYGAPSRFLRSEATCNMHTIDPRLHTDTQNTHQTHNCHFCCVLSLQAINPERLICKLKCCSCVQILRIKRFEDMINLSLFHAHKPINKAMCGLFMHLTFPGAHTHLFFLLPSEWQNPSNICQLLLALVSFGLEVVEVIWFMLPSFVAAGFRHNLQIKNVYFTSDL